MKTKTVSSGYLGISADQVEAIAASVPGSDSLLWCRRNKVWRSHIDGTDVVVKSFGSAFMGEAVYALRTSKARRSYEYACEIRRRGFDSPVPIGYIERRGKAGVLLESAYICAYSSAVALEDAIASYGQDCIRAFADYAAALHEAGIRHDDLNSTNVRVSRQSDGSFRFSLIDLNRMRIYPPGVKLPMHECFINVSRFTYDREVMEVFARAYAKARALPESYADVIVETKLDFDRRFFRRKDALHALGRVFGIKSAKNRKK